MQYKDLKEMTLKDWDGWPFYAVVKDINSERMSCDDIRDLKTGKGGKRIVAFTRGRWVDDDGVSWHHVYPFSMNKLLIETSKPRMTKRQFAMWLAKGNGEYSSHSLLNAYTNNPYHKGDENKLVDDSYKVRKWDSEEWIEPTVDLLEGL